MDLAAQEPIRGKGVPGMKKRGEKRGGGLLSGLFIFPECIGGRTVFIRFYQVAEFIRIFQNVL